MRGTCVRQELSITICERCTNTSSAVSVCFQAHIIHHPLYPTLQPRCSSLQTSAKRAKKDTKRLRILNLKILNLMY